MAEKTAGIKVDIKGDGAKAGIRAISGETKRAAGEMQGALSSALSNGLKGGTDALKGAFSTIKSTVLSIGGIAGGLGLAEMAREAIHAEGAYRKIAFQIRAGTGEMISMRDVQKETHAAALATGQASDDLAKSMAAVFQETGDADFARNTMETIGTAAKGAHEPLETMSGLAGTLNEKFGITEGVLGGALAQIVSLGNKGGVSVGDMGEKLGLIGAFAKEAGLQGEEGLGTVIGMMNLADNATGNLKKGITAVGGLLEQLSTTSGKAKIGAALGISGKDMKGDVVSQIAAIEKATKGNKGQLEKAFGGEQLKLLVDLGKTYAASFDSTKGDVKTKTAAAVEAVRGSFEAASKSSLTFADLQKEAAAEMQTGEGKVQTALEKLRQAFAKPEVTAAIEKLMGQLPALADIIAKLVSFASSNPMLAAGAAVGGTFAKGALESAIVGAFKSGAAAAGPSLAASMAGSASPFAASLAPLMGPIGLALGASIGIMLIASMHQAKLDQEKRDAEAKDAQKMIKQGKGPLGGAYQAAGALEAATGLEFDPNTAISDATAGQSTSNLDNRDKAMADRLLAKGKRENAALATGNALASRHPEWFIDSTPGGAGATSADPLAGGVSGARGRAGVPGASGGSSAAPPAVDPAAMGQALKMAFPQEQRVFVANAKDIGGSSGPTGGGVILPGWKPR